jgi:predicted nucleotidyltransferase
VYLLVLLIDERPEEVTDIVILPGSIARLEHERRQKSAGDGRTMDPPMPVNMTGPHGRALDEFTRIVRDRLGPNLVALKLFGSRARGDAASDSDIDVLVVVADRRLEAEDVVLDIAFEVNLAHDVYISPRVLERATLEHPVWRITPFLQAIEREGVPL